MPELAVPEAAISHRPATILLVDDDETFRYAAARALEGAGFAVASAPDFRAALDLLESGRQIDLLVTDIVMPERVHGFALARMARMRHRGLKVLYLTGYDVPTVEAAGKVLRKPVTDDQLVAEVQAALAS